MFDRKTPIRNAIFILSIYSIFHIYWYIGFKGHPAATDTYAFHLVGTLIWKGEILKAYSNAAMKALQAADLGSSTQFFPWPYPLQFDLVAALLGLVSVAMAYLLFVGTTYAAYLALLWKMSGKDVGAVLQLLFPAIIVTIFAGQNGFLTAVLIGIFVSLFSRRRGWAGLPLGLMVIKPHLALGLGVLVLIKRRWDILSVAILIVVATSVLCALIFGPDAWLAFWSNAKQQSRMMLAGSFLAYRMTSIYAALVSWGISDRLAMVVQLIGSAGAIALIAWSHVCRHPQRLTLAFAVMATLAISPYVYDYDMPIFGVAVALILPQLRRSARKSEWIAVHLCVWIATGTGFFYIAAKDLSVFPVVSWIMELLRLTTRAPTAAGFFYLIAVGIAAVIVSRGLREDTRLAKVAPAAGFAG